MKPVNYNKMTKEEIQNAIEDIAQNGATGGCNMAYIEKEASKLADKVVKLFVISDVVSTFTCSTCGCHEKEWSIKNNDWYCKRCKHICR